MLTPRLRYAALAAIAALIVPSAVISAQKSADAALARKMNTFSAIINELQQNYVDSIEIDKTFDAAINTMMYTIDPYTEYYNVEERKNFETMTTGEFGGIGSSILYRDGATYISGPFEGSPAARAGLRAGDEILRVDTTSTRGMTSDQVVSMMRGTPGTSVTLQVKRPYVTDSILSFTFGRELVKSPSVPYYGMVADGIGYITLTQFIEKSASEVKTAIEELTRTAPLRGIVLDLRSNGGGLLEASIDILGYFLPKGTEVLRTRGKKEERIFKTTHRPLLENVPLVVLIDNGSASASEVTAGAIQDLDRGVLAGSRSFGKGLVQTTRPLPYNELLKYTTAKYYIPSGRLIQALDYSHRDANGAATRTPDSLTNVFHTRAGREVRDGGGLKPDVEIDWGEGNRLMYNLVRDNWMFDYANRYANTHDSICAPEDFVITDEIYEDFKQFIDPERFKYDKVCEEGINTLRKTAEAEGYMNDDVSRQFDELAKALTHDLQSDLDLKREEIAEYLAIEIVERYYYARGQNIQYLKNDKGVKTAIEILNDPARYKELLSAKK